MKSLLTVTVLLFTNLVYGHDIRMAIFEISEGENGYALEISFDKEDLFKSLSIALGAGETEELIKDYLEGNFQVVFNGKCITPKIEGIKYEEEYIRVACAIPSMLNKVETIDVYNTCLLDNEGHMNIIKSKLYGRTRTFRMTNERTSTIIDYRE